MQGTIIICYYIHKHYILSQSNYTKYENHKTQPSQQQDAIISHSKASKNRSFNFNEDDFIVPIWRKI